MTLLVAFFCVGTFFMWYGFGCLLDNKPGRAFLCFVLFTINMLYVLANL